MNIKKFLVGVTGGALMLGAMIVPAFAAVNAVTPSTNDINRTNGWAHVDQLSEGVGTTNLQFISTRALYSCFEYRTDGNTSQRLSANSGNNYNTLITDGLYPYYCQNNNNSTYTITANEYVEVRMVFGAETDERFDWTRFDVLPTPVGLPTDKNQCKDNGWETFTNPTFKNQGQCVSYVQSNNHAGKRN